MAKGWKGKAIIGEWAAKGKHVKERGESYWAMLAQLTLASNP